MGESKEELYQFAWNIFQLVKESWDETIDEKIREEKSEQILNQRWEFFKKLENFSNYAENISYYDTSDLFREIESRTNIPYEKITFEQFTNYLGEYLFGDSFNFEFCFRFGNNKIFPSGHKLGYCTMYPFNDLPPKIKERVEWAMRFEYHDDNEYQKSKEDYIEHRKTNDNYMYLEVKSFGRQDATAKAISLSNRSSNILKFINAFKRFSIYGDDPLSHFNYYYNCEKFELGGSRRGTSFGGLPIHRWEIQDYLTNSITEMMLKDNPTELEDRILNIIDVYGMIDDSTPLHLSFILCVIALEGLLLHDGEKDYLGWKLAEKLSFLLGTSVPWMLTLYGIHDRTKITPQFISENMSDARKKLFEKISTIYNKRSRFAHSGLDPRKNKDKIFAKDYQDIFLILRWTVGELIRLHGEGMETIVPNSQKDGKSFDEYIQKLKFQG